MHKVLYDRCLYISTSEWKPHKLRKVTEEAIFIHGTFAASEDDEGNSWWQVNSPFWKIAADKMGSVVPTSNPFHWSGGNTDGHRQIAGAKLFERIRSTEHPFHLVGHSHGGMVILYALYIAIENGVELPNLRSWFTVGTPFLHHRFSWWKMIKVSIVGWRHDWVCWVVIHAGLAISVAIASILNNKLLLSLVAWLVALVLLLIVGCRWYRAYVQSRRFEDIRATAWEKYGNKWDGFISQYDEALLLLRRSLDIRVVLPGPVTPRFRRRGPIWKYSHADASKVPGFVPTPDRPRARMETVGSRMVTCNIPILADRPVHQNF